MIIINYKSEEVLNEAIKSIKEEFLDISIYILDNGSTPESLDKLKHLSSDKIKIISSKENLGYSNGLNYTYMYLKKKNLLSDYIFLLNPDAVIQQNMIFNLYSILNKNPDVAAISPRIINNDGYDEFNGLYINWNKCIIRPNSDIAKSSTINAKFVDVFHGCAVLLDAKKFYEVGLFNKDIFMYYDETFLSMEFSKLSYKILYSDVNIVKHLGSHSAGKYSYLKSYYHTRNHLLFFAKYSEKSNKFCKYKDIIMTMLSSIKHLHFKNLFGALKGVFDFWIGKSGKINT